MRQFIRVFYNVPFLKCPAWLKICYYKQIVLLSTASYVRLSLDHTVNLSYKISCPPSNAHLTTNTTVTLSCCWSIQGPIGSQINMAFINISQNTNILIDEMIDYDNAESQTTCRYDRCDRNNEVFCQERGAVKNIITGNYVSLRLDPTIAVEGIITVNILNGR